MEILEGLKLKGRPAEIPNCSRDDLPEFFKKLGLTIGVEIGVYKGEFTEKFAKVGLKIYGVDPWKAYEDFDLIKDNRVKRQEFLYGHARRLLDPYPNCVLLRKTSMEALKDFENESLDFVYIDGNHRFKYVAEDMCEWWKKIKKGGFMCGHDYIHPKRFASDRTQNLHVKFVVDAYVEAFQIKNWYLIGQKDAPYGDRRDRFLSWMFIKE